MHSKVFEGKMYRCLQFTWENKKIRWINRWIEGQKANKANCYRIQVELNWVYNLYNSFQFLFFMINEHHKMLGEKRKLDIREIVSFY